MKFEVGQVVKNCFNSNFFLLVTKTCQTRFSGIVLAGDEIGKLYEDNLVYDCWEYHSTLKEFLNSLKKVRDFEIGDVVESKDYTNYRFIVTNIVDSTLFSATCIETVDEPNLQCVGYHCTQLDKKYFKYICKFEDYSKGDC